MAASKVMFGLNPAERQKLCFEAGVDHRTLLKYLGGGACFGTVTRRIEKTIRELDLTRKITEARKATGVESGPEAA